MVLTGSSPCPGPWPRTYGAHLHCRPVRIQTPTASAVPSTSDKSQLRTLARATRQPQRSDAFAERLASHASRLRVRPGLVVAGYHAHQDEADPALLLMALAHGGAHVAFPRIVGKNM